MFLTDAKLKTIPSKYLPEGFDISSWDEVKGYLEALCAEDISTPRALEALIEKYSDLLKAMNDELSWRYIHMTLAADDESKADAYNDYFANTYAPTEAYQFKIKELYNNSPAHNLLDADKYALLNQIITNDIELFRLENIPLQIQESELANKYGSIVSKMSAFFDGEERTPAQLAVYLKDTDRSKREEAWRLRMGLFEAHQTELNELYDSLRDVRGKLAANSGYDNYRDYKHKEMGRFSYTPEDIHRFHDAVERVVMPFVKELDDKRKEALELPVLRPWDTSVDLDGRKLKPFETTDEFISKSLIVLNKVNPDYAIQLEMMKNTNLLDLENRKGKAPGGYNTGLNNLASSFIFMNHVKQHNDVITLLHESGHAMHSAATGHIKIAQYLETPSEVAELASMTMELLTMDYWGEYYSSAEDLKKAKRDQLQGTLSFLPWCMIVDAFQQWVYLNPKHTTEERFAAYLGLHKRFAGNVDWSDLEHLRKLGWMMQLHIFEVPFYYIEYGMAQLGALSIYMNYRKDKAKALKQYQAFLDLGYSKPVREIYQTAGIEFDFSEARIRELVEFVKSELAEIEKI
ncbi:MAG: M3 family oligoendopeptidase [Candidatus Cloacimonetes bacterium HGW-Cloacimonetes-3]|jgi:oligoendopeptidase F|nr:MAG: M3 family oligoendopeptidase [Candidatus Cloacimonetes bacterium HGW-Cloacimonetes-3]